MSFCLVTLGVFVHRDLNRSLLEVMDAFDIHSEFFSSPSARWMQKHLLWLLFSMPPASFIYCSSSFSVQLLVPLP